MQVFTKKFQADLNPHFVASLLTKFDEISESVAKRPKGPQKTNVVEKEFGTNETWEEFNLRAVFVLDVLNARKLIPSSDKVLAALFALVKQSVAIKSTSSIFLFSESTRDPMSKVHLISNIWLSTRFAKFSRTLEKRR